MPARLPACLSAYLPAYPLLKVCKQATVFCVLMCIRQSVCMCMYIKGLTPRSVPVQGTEKGRVAAGGVSMGVCDGGRGKEVNSLCCTEG